MVGKVRQFSYLFYSLLFITSACQGDSPISTLEDPVPSQERDFSSAGIVFSLPESEFDTSPTSIATILKNTTSNACSYGDFFSIEQKQDGLWYRVKYSENIYQDFPDFIDIGKVLNPYETVTQDFSIERLNLTLTEGEYRLNKTVLCPFPQGSEITVSVPFEVKE